MHKVLITGAIHPVGLERLQQESDVEVHYAPDLLSGEILKIIEPFHCILTRSETPITRELLDCAPHLWVVARAAVGVGNIDIAYATERGILVINTPAKNTNSAAELTLGLADQYHAQVGACPLAHGQRGLGSAPIHRHRTAGQDDRNCWAGERWASSRTVCAGV
jgi:phosphoglycerate dehydrogenase-like enzyme